MDQGQILTFKSKTKTQSEEDVIAKVILKNNIVTLEMTASKIAITRIAALKLALLLIAASSTNAVDII